MIEEDDLKIFDSSVGMTQNQQFSIEITRLDKNDLEKIKQSIIINQKLRERIIDLTDLWDGKESWKYGNSLQNILDELGINEMPKFYGQEMKDMLDEISRDMKK